VIFGWRFLRIADCGLRINEFQPAEFVLVFSAKSISDAYNSSIRNGWVVGWAQSR
jgi:hypothetical protein